jgi:hypothetical protein
MVGRGVGRIDAEGLDGVDCLKHFLDLRPAGNAQQNRRRGARRRGRVSLASPTAQGCRHATRRFQSFDVQRTNAKMRPPRTDLAALAGDHALLRNLPKRIRPSMRPFTHELDSEIGHAIPRTVGKPRNEVAQQLGDGDDAGRPRP